MKLAISNIAWEPGDDAFMLQELPRHGCAALEIAPTRVFPEQPYAKLPQAKAFATQLKQTTGMPVCSMQSIWYRRTESIFGTAQEVAALVEYTKDAILFAQAMGCPNLVFGCPKNRIVPPGSQPEEAVGFFRTVGAFAQENGCVIALEAVPVSYGTNFLNETRQLYDFVRLVDSAGVGMNLDFGTLFVNREDPAQIADYLPSTSHVHISENALEGIQDRPEHRTFLAALKASGYSRYVSIEMKNQNSPAKVLDTVDYVRRVMACGL